MRWLMLPNPIWHNRHCTPYRHKLGGLSRTRAGDPYSEPMASTYLTASSSSTAESSAGLNGRSRRRAEAGDLPRDFRSPLKSGHSSFGYRMARCAPFATFAGSSRIKRSNSNRSFEPAPASVGDAWQLPQLFFEIVEIDRLRDELGSA